MNGFVVQVRTRSKVHDYRFIGANPPTERWWEKSYGRWTDFARLTILVEPGKFFVSGIPSMRTDSKGAAIHYALHAQVAPDAHALAAQVLAWLCDMRQRTGTLEEAGNCLDNLGEAAWSDAVLGEQANVDKINAAVMALLRESPRQAEIVDTPQLILRSADDSTAFALLAARATSVIAMEVSRKERAVYLNLASSSELESLLQQKGSAIICREVDKRPKTSRPLLAGAAVVVLGTILVVTLLSGAFR